MSNLPGDNTKPIGVIYAPFQSAVIPDVHRKAIEEAEKRHETVVIALPVRRITPSKVSPLDFRTRQEMIMNSYYNLLVVPVEDQKYSKNKVWALETAVRAPFSEFRGADLYLDAEFEPTYKEHGKWSVWDTYDFVPRESAARKGSKLFPVHHKMLDMSEAFRHGIIYGLTNQFPISWSTVDICIKRVIDGKTYILLGKKPGEYGWRFPGGFKDRADTSYEIAVHREAGEEVLKEGIAPIAALTPPKYIGSVNINDWRYVKEIDGITTLFYQVQFVGVDDQIKAGDDLADTEWFELADLNEVIMEGEHVKLLRMLRGYEGIV